MSVNAVPLMCGDRQEPQLLKYRDYTHLICRGTILSARDL